MRLHDERAQNSGAQLQWQWHRGLSALEARKIFVVAVGLSRQHTLASCGDPPSDAIALGGSENGFSNSEGCKIVADEQFKLFGFGRRGLEKRGGLTTQKGNAVFWAWGSSFGFWGLGSEKGG